MEITISQNQGAATITLKGKVDEQGATLLKHHFKELDLSKLKEVIFDFGNVLYIGSAGIGKLLLFYKELAMHDLNLKVVNTSEDIFNLFQILKLDNVFKVTR